MLARTVTGLALALAVAPTAAAGQSHLVIIPARELGALPAAAVPAPPPDTTGNPLPDALPAAQADPLAPIDPPDLASHPSAGIRAVTNWIIASGDNNGLPFMVIDKVQASVFVHLADGTLAGAGPALFGLAPGDDSVPGIGEKKLSMIGNHEKTTPAGRFVANFGPAEGNITVLWIDYRDSVSMHSVITGNKKERRLQRLESPTPEDNRITFGCINVMPDFYRDIVKPIFKDTRGIVYILPEIKSLAEVFPTLAAQPETVAGTP